MLGGALLGLPGAAGGGSGSSAGYGTKALQARLQPVMRALAGAALRLALLVGGTHGRLALRVSLPGEALPGPPADADADAGAPQAKAPEASTGPDGPPAAAAALQDGSSPPAPAAAPAPPTPPPAAVVASWWPSPRAANGDDAMDVDTGHGAAAAKGVPVAAQAVVSELRALYLGPYAPPPPALAAAGGGSSGRSSSPGFCCFSLAPAVVHVGGTGGAAAGCGSAARGDADGEEEPVVLALVPEVLVAGRMG